MCIRDRNQDGWTTVYGSTVLNLNQWYQVTVTYENEILRIYLNGEMESETSVTSNIINNDGDLYIGRYHEYENYFVGNIDEVSIWSLAMDQEQILTNMFSDNAGYQPGLVARWKFNANDGDILYDHSGNANHGTINGAAWDEGFVAPPILSLIHI